MKRRNSLSFRSGFTLIELLVVIAIIALLAAILFPVFARARENARRSSCQSNMKQMGLGFIQYAQDFDEKYPCGANATPGYAAGQGWGAQVFPYIKSTQVYRCPSDMSTIYTYDPDWYVVSYCYNSSIPYPSWWYGTGVFVGTVASMNAVTKTVLLFESANTGGQITSGVETDRMTPATWGTLSTISSVPGNTGGWFATGLLAGRGGTVVSDPTLSTINMYGSADRTGFMYPYGRHLEGSNFLMADGHVKWLKGDQVSTGQAAASATAQQATYDAEGTSYSGTGAHAVTFSPT